jgi:hypothetical protein
MATVKFTATRVMPVTPKASRPRSTGHARGIKSFRALTPIDADDASKLETTVGRAGEHDARSDAPCAGSAARAHRCVDAELHAHTASVLPGQQEGSRGRTGLH